MQGLRYALDTVSAPPLETPEICAFVDLVRPVRDRSDLFLTSWFRSPTDNENVGGAPASLHLEGLAVDLDKFGADLDVYRDLAEEFNNDGLAVVVYYDANRSYLHVQARPLLSGALLSIVT